MSPAKEKFKKIELHGLEEVSLNIQKLVNDNWDDAKDALLKETNIVLKDSVRQTPHEFGNLRRSGAVDVIKETRKDFDVMIGFDMEYAAAVHENMEAYHPKGKAKYLEDPLFARIDKIPKNIAKRIRAGMKI